MHTIRLRGPWDVAEVAASPGTTRCTRRFHKPSGLCAAERVWLAIEGLSGAAAVTLNGASVGPASRLSPARFDVTSLLQPYNELIIDIACPHPSDPATCLGQVRLEIESEIWNPKSEI